MSTIQSGSRCVAVLAVATLTTLVSPGCSTAPKAENREDFMSRARSTTTWFKNSVSGLSAQIDQSAGYIVFPDVSQWGFVFAGGTHGRGALFSPDGTHQGWAAINTGSLGLQAGVQGFRMLIVLQDQTTLDRFKTNTLDGSASGVAVAGESAATGSAPFSNGVAVYEGANEGLMAGVNIGLSHVRYRPTDQE